MGGVLWTRGSAAKAEWCESTRWLEDSVRLLVPTSVSLSEPRVSYSSDSDLPWLTLCVLCNGAEYERPPRTLVYRLQSDCNQTELIFFLYAIKIFSNLSHFTTLFFAFFFFLNDISIQCTLSHRSYLNVNASQCVIVFFFFCLCEWPAKRSKGGPAVVLLNDDF